MYRPASNEEAQPQQVRVVYLRPTPTPWLPLVLASAAGSIVGIWAWERLTAEGRVARGRR